MDTKKSHLVRYCKRQKFKIQKQKITEKSTTLSFWKEIRKLNPTSKTISNNIDDVNRPLEISNLFYEKYRCLSLQQRSDFYKRT